MGPYPVSSRETLAKMAMSDRYDQDILLDYIEGELSPEQRAAFEQQLAGDEALRRLVERLQADRAALRSLPSEAPPRDLLDDATHQLEREMLLGPTPEAASAQVGGEGGGEAGVAGRLGRDPRRRTPWTKPATYAALAAVVALCAGVLLISLTDNALLEEASRFARSQSSPEQVQPGQVPPGEAFPGERGDGAGEFEAGDGEAMPVVGSARVAGEADGEAGVGDDEPRLALGSGDRVREVLSEPLGPWARAPVSEEVGPADAPAAAAPPAPTAMAAQTEAQAQAEEPPAPQVADAAQAMLAEEVEPAPAADSLLEEARLALEALREAEAQVDVDDTRRAEALAEGAPSTLEAEATEGARQDASPRRLVVATRSAARTRRELKEWARHNQAMVLAETGAALSDPMPRAGASDAVVARAYASDEAGAGPGADDGERDAAEADSHDAREVEASEAQRGQRERIAAPAPEAGLEAGLDAGLADDASDGVVAEPEEVGAADEGRLERLRLRVRPEQMQALVSHLNREPAEQRAALAGSPPELAGAPRVVLADEVDGSVEAFGAALARSGLATQRAQLQRSLDAAVEVAMAARAAVGGRRAFEAEVEAEAEGEAEVEVEVEADGRPVADGGIEQQARRATRLMERAAGEVEAEAVDEAVDAGVGVFADEPALAKRMDWRWRIERQLSPDGLGEPGPLEWAASARPAEAAVAADGRTIELAVVIDERAELPPVDDEGEADPGEAQRQAEPGPAESESESEPREGAER